MAMFAPIPLPQPGNPQFKDVADYFLQLQQAKAQRDQFGKSLAEKQSEFGQNMAQRKSEFAQNYLLAREAQDNANQLMPLRVQQFQDTHKREATDYEVKSMYADTIKDEINKLKSSAALNQGAPTSNAAPPGAPPSAPPTTDNSDSTALNWNNGVPQAQGAIPQAVLPNGQQQPNAGMPQQPNPVANAVAAGAASASSAMPSSAPPPQGAAPPQTGNNKYDKLHQMMIAAGYIKESPEEREARAVQTALASKQGESDITKSQQYLDAGDIINKYAGNLKTIYELLNKDPGVTGNYAGVKSAIHTESENQGAFNAAAVPLVGALAKDISQRGGAVVAGMAQAAKPSKWQSIQGNLGRTKELIRQSVTAYNNAKSEYERITGKPYPKELDPFLKQFQNQGSADMVTIRNKKTGETKTISRDEAKQLGAL